MNETRTSMSDGKKKAARAVLALLAAALLVAAFVGASKVHDVRLTATDIQRMVSDRLPLTTKGGITVRAVDVSITDSVRVSAHVTGEKFGKPWSLKAGADGTLTYDAFEGAFHFAPDALTVDEFTFAGGTVSSAVEGAVTGVAGSETARDVTSTMAESEGGFAGIGRAFERGRSILSGNAAAIGKAAESEVHGLATAAVVAYLGSHPVYVLPDDVKGNAVRLLVENVEAKDGAVVISMSFWQLAWYVIGFLVVSAAFIAIAVVGGPGLELVLLPFTWFG